jgi:hypothetical protein
MALLAHRGFHYIEYLISLSIARESITYTEPDLVARRNVDLDTSMLKPDEEYSGNLLQCTIPLPIKFSAIGLSTQSFYITGIINKRSGDPVGFAYFPIRRGRGDNGERFRIIKEVSPIESEASI